MYVFMPLLLIAVPTKLDAFKAAICKRIICQYFNDELENREMWVSLKNKLVSSIKYAVERIFNKNWLEMNSRLDKLSSKW